ncbi:cytochrome P450 [Sistotremastrum suecicum HHB10207 ss-3]|uniref:Cytochrome P450 n=1 Tax=Sistotremastrum suecicum HHB10207 ss-3 TaxID=1314776 RepID=A0A166D5D0_9AGAM|nr:cytochrome P450 [Sistotremastrum suecicum HHB10207 ss-3]
MKSDHLLGLIPSLDNAPLSEWIRLLGGFSILLFVAKSIHSLLFSPLGHVPGPWYTSFTSLELAIHCLRFQKCEYIQGLFNKYGPVVRIGPNKVAFLDSDSVKIVYGTGRFNKSSWYKGVQICDQDHAMTTLDHAGHAIRRKTFTQFYAPAHLAKYQPEIHDAVLELMKILDILDGSVSIDCLPLFRHMMVDINGITMFGSHIGVIHEWGSGGEHPLSTAVSDFPKRGALKGLLPSLLWSLVSSIPNSRWQQFCVADRVLVDFVGKRVKETSRFLKEHPEQEKDAGRSTLLSTLLLYRYSNTDEAVPEQDVLTESIAHLIAGSDTTATTLAYICWELSKRPDIMRSLREEIDLAMPDARSIPDIQVLQNLPYLNALLKEGLRLYSAAPAMLERVVPIGKDFAVHNVAIPGDTIVGSQAWSSHRRPEIFPQPEKFMPERWLPGAETEEMLAHFMPYGYGSRNCAGQNMSQLMLRILVTSLARNFDVVSKVSETNDKTMSMRDSFVMFPAALECKLSFVPRSNL